MHLLIFIYLASINYMATVCQEPSSKSWSQHCVDKPSPPPIQLHYAW